MLVAVRVFVILILMIIAIITTIMHKAIIIIISHFSTRAVKLGERTSLLHGLHCPTGMDPKRMKGKAELSGI